MALIIKTLNSGHISTTGVYDLYPVAASKSALVASIRLVNTGGGTCTTSVMVRKSPSTSDYLIWKYMVPITGSNSLILEDPVTLGPSDKLRIDVTSGGTPSLDFQISGVERDL